jgi:hypothetical protein
VRVIREMQIVVARAIQIDPALDCGALRRTDGHRQRGRTVGRYHHAGRDSDPIYGRSYLSIDLPLPGKKTGTRFYPRPCLVKLSFAIEVFR